MKLVYEDMCRLLWKEFGTYLDQIDDLEINLDLIMAQVLLLCDSFNIEAFNDLQ